MSKPDFLKLPFKEQIEYFRSKVPVTTERWNELTDEEYEYAFTIAGLTKADLLVDAKLLVDRAIADGMSLEDFQKQFKRSIGRRGWMEEANKPARTRVIYETNLARSYAAGRYQQQTDPEVLDERPYWMWRHRTPDPAMGGQPRPEHKALDGKILPADDPFWKVAYPSCAFGCRCGVFSVSEDYMKRKGLSVSRFPDPKTIADPGFRKAPGSGTDVERKQVLQQKMKTLPPELQAKVREQLRTDSRVRKYKKGKKCGKGYISQDEECQVNQLKSVGGLKGAIAMGAILAAGGLGGYVAMRQRKDPNYNPIKDTFKIANDIPTERRKTLSPQTQTAILTGAAVVGVPTATYLAARARYRAGFAESARMAQEKVQEFPVEDIGDKEQITFTVGGFYGNDGEEKARAGENYFTENLKTKILGDKENPGGRHLVVTHSNREFNLPQIKSQGAVGAFELTSEYYKAILKTSLVQGRNPEAVNLASRAIAYHQKYPDKPINLVGHSAGGMITHETAEILNTLSPKIPVKIVNMGTPWYGLTNKVGQSYTITDKTDYLIQTTAQTRDTVLINKNEETTHNMSTHYLKHYLKDPESNKKLKELLK